MRTVWDRARERKNGKLTLGNWSHGVSGNALSDDVPVMMPTKFCEYLTRFITRVDSPLSSSSGVGGRGLVGAPLDEGPTKLDLNNQNISLGKLIFID